MDSVSRYHEKSLPSSNWTCGTCCGTIEFQWGEKFPCSPAANIASCSSALDLRHTSAGRIQCSRGHSSPACMIRAVRTEDSAPDDAARLGSILFWVFPIFPVYRLLSRLQCRRLGLHAQRKIVFEYIIRFNTTAFDQPGQWAAGMSPTMTWRLVAAAGCSMKVHCCLISGLREWMFSRMLI